MVVTRFVIFVDDIKHLTSKMELKEWYDTNKMSFYDPYFSRSVMIKPFRRCRNTGKPQVEVIYEDVPKRILIVI